MDWNIHGIPHSTDCCGHISAVRAADQRHSDAGSSYYHFFGTDRMDF